MVDDLELETAMDEIQSGRTGGVHCRPEYFLSE